MAWGDVCCFPSADRRVSAEMTDVVDSVASLVEFDFADCRQAGMQHRIPGYYWVVAVVHGNS